MYVIAAADESDNDSAHKQDLNYEPMAHFCHPRVFIQDTDDMLQNVTVNRCQVETIYFLPKVGVPLFK